MSMGKKEITPRGSWIKSALKFKVRLDELLEIISEPPEVKFTLKEGVWYGSTWSRNGSIAATGKSLGELVKNLLAEVENDIGD